ncbi:MULTISPECIES: DUF4307 domain-containing protein [unclassified Streptomyces]|uniref:DUF4307 domain-containing protein n=1 Tax=unclassified Streptomyces TaxID=2593676 RepID=UPI003BB7B584
MSAVQQLPEGRYGSSRSADARADRKLKIAGIVLGTLFAAMMVWFGWYYVVGGSKFSGELIAFDTNKNNVQVHMEIRKDSDATGYCTIRSQSEDGAEVGRADFRFDQKQDRIDKVVTLRTTGRATSAELIGCHAD